MNKVHPYKLGTPAIWVPSYKLNETKIYLLSTQFVTHLFLKR